MTNTAIDSIIISDSKWEVNKDTSRPHRGITDYERTIRFKYEPKSAELVTAILDMVDDKKPGWTPTNILKITPTTWRFSCTFDSSD